MYFWGPDVGGAYIKIHVKNKVYGCGRNLASLH